MRKRIRDHYAWNVYKQTMTSQMRKRISWIIMCSYGNWQCLLFCNFASLLCSNSGAIVWQDSLLSHIPLRVYYLCLSAHAWGPIFVGRPAIAIKLWWLTVAVILIATNFRWPAIATKYQWPAIATSFNGRLLPSIPGIGIGPWPWHVYILHKIYVLNWSFSHSLHNNVIINSDKIHKI